MIRPDYYQDNGGIEPIDVWQAWELNGFLASAVKYIHRAGRKEGADDDLQKAATYLMLACERKVRFDYWDRGSERAFVRPEFQYWAIVKAWNLPPNLREALGALLFARSWLDYKVAANHITRMETPDA